MSREWDDTEAIGQVMNDATAWGNADLGGARCWMISEPPHSAEWYDQGDVTDKPGANLEFS